MAMHEKSQIKTQGAPLSQLIECQILDRKNMGSDLKRDAVLCL